MNTARQWKRRLALLLALVLTLALAACGEAGAFVSESDEETGGTDVTAENADKGTGAIGYVTIGQGECLVISPDLTKGSFTVCVAPMAGEPSAEDTGIGDETVLEETIQGREMTAYDLEPGEYAVGITVEEKATGTMKIMPYSIEELAQQDAALAEALNGALGQEEGEAMGAALGLEAASDDWSCFGTFNNADGHAVNIDLLTGDGYPVTLTLKDDGDYTGYLHKEGPELYGGLQNEAGKYVTVTVSYDGEKTVSVLFEDVEDSPAVKTGDRIDLLP